MWFDYNGDGLLDVYVVNYLKYDGTKIPFYAPTGFPGPLTYQGEPDALYRNNGDGTFTDVTEEAGMVNPNGRGMGATVADLDNDGRLDVYVTNDAMANDFFRNLGGGKFAEDALVRGMAFGEVGQGVSSMGPDAGDIDLDGWLDLYIPDMDYGCLLIEREGVLRGRDHAQRAGPDVRPVHRLGRPAVRLRQRRPAGRLRGQRRCPQGIRRGSHAGPQRRRTASSSTWPRTPGRISRKSTWAAGRPAATSTTTATWTC